MCVSVPTGTNTASSSWCVKMPHSCGGVSVLGALPASAALRTAHAHHDRPAAISGSSPTVSPSAAPSEYPTTALLQVGLGKVAQVSREFGISGRRWRVRSLRAHCWDI